MLKDVINPVGDVESQLEELKMGLDHEDRIVFEMLVLHWQMTAEIGGLSAPIARALIDSAKADMQEYLEAEESSPFIREKRSEKLVAAISQAGEIILGEKLETSEPAESALDEIQKN